MQDIEHGTSPWLEVVKAPYVYHVVNNNTAAINLDEIVKMSEDKDLIAIHIASGVSVKSSRSSGVYITELPFRKHLVLINEGTILGDQGHPGLNIIKPLDGTFELINCGTIYGGGAEGASIDGLSRILTIKRGVLVGPTKN